MHLIHHVVHMYIKNSKNKKQKNSKKKKRKESKKKLSLKKIFQLGALGPQVISVHFQEQICTRGIGPS